MTWYCGNCEYMNSVNDLYCCHCHRMKDSFALGDGELSSTASLTGSVAFHRTDYITHDDGNHGHIMVSPSNHLNSDLIPHDTISAPPEDPHDGRWRKFWYCCSCGDGPHGAGNIPACNCQHVHCDGCEMVLLKMKVSPSD